MKLALCSLASGSSGNCYVVASEETCILVDAGISGRQIGNGLEEIGRTHVDALLLTHEHSDHIKGLSVLLKKGVRIYTNKKTQDALKGLGLEFEAENFITGEKFLVGDIQVSSFSVSHDAADPSGFSFEKDGAVITIITDTGYVTEDAFSYMTKADILVLESNHDESMLRVGSYPWFLKQRILGEKGHLSNEAAAEALLKALKFEALSGANKERLVLLAHLSRENNFPEMAKTTFESILEAGGFGSKNIRIITLKRDEKSVLYTL